jgi:hypothetical protein
MNPFVISQTSPLYARRRHARAQRWWLGSQVAVGRPAPRFGLWGARFACVGLQGTKRGGELLAVHVGCKCVPILVIYYKCIIITNTGRINVRLERQWSWEIYEQPYRTKLLF